jgi:hypothetical protein
VILCQLTLTENPGMVPDNGINLYQLTLTENPEMVPDNDLDL